MLQFRESYVTTDPTTPDGQVLARSDPARVMLRIYAGDVLLMNPRITTRNEVVIDGGIPFDSSDHVVTLTAKDDGPMVTQEWRLNQASAGTFTIFEVWDDERPAFPVRVPRALPAAEEKSLVIPRLALPAKRDFTERLGRIVEAVMGANRHRARHPLADGCTPATTSVPSRPGFTKTKEG